MKKIILCVFLCMFALISCVDKHAYTVTGEFANENYDGQTVYLQRMDAGTNYEMVTIATSKVEKNRFQFKGIASDTIQLQFISIDADNEQKHAKFIAERGKIVITFDSSESVVVKGTPLNDKYQAFTDGINQMFEEFEKQYQETEKLLKNDSTGNTMEEYAAYSDLFFNKIKEKICVFVQPNMNNAIGEQVFEEYSYYLNPKQILNLLAGASPEFRSNKRIKDIEKRAIAQDKTAVGQLFTDVKGKNLDGKDVVLSDYVGKGKVVLIDFWASWCVPCIHSLPDIAALYKKYKNKGFEIVGISLDNNQESWANATRKHQVTWPQLSNLQGGEDEAALTYGVTGIPHTILIDKNGVILEKDLDAKMLSYKLGVLLE